MDEPKVRFYSRGKPIKFYTRGKGEARTVSPNAATSDKKGVSGREADTTAKACEGKAASPPQNLILLREAAYFISAFGYLLVVLMLMTA